MYFNKNILSSAFFRLDNKGGFTVIEVLVAAGIVVVLLVYFLMNFKGFDNQLALNNEADKLVTVLRQAQIYALVGQTYGGVRYNYGLHVDECASGNCNYTLFYDFDGDNHYDISPTDETLESNNLLKIVFVDDLQVGASAPTELDIIFKPPTSTIHFYSNSLELSEESAQITIENNSGGQKTISINNISGQIDIQ